jgi:hypothetical protein
MIRGATHLRGAGTLIDWTSSNVSTPARNFSKTSRRGAIDPHLDEGKRSCARVMGIEQRGVALDVALFFEAPYAIGTGRGGQMNLAGRPLACKRLRMSLSMRSRL